MTVQESSTQDELFLKRIITCDDLFTHEKNSVLPKTTFATLLVGLTLGLYLSMVDLSSIISDFLEPSLEVPQITLVEDITLPRTPKEEKPKVIAIKKPKIQKRRSLVSDKNTQVTKVASGGGNVRSRVSQKGVLGLMTSSTTKHVGDNALARGGFATGIDKVLEGVGGLKKGDGGPKRIGNVDFVGSGVGRNSGFGDGDVTNDVLALMQTLGGPSGSGIELKKRRVKERKVSGPSGATSKSISGKRSRSDIMRVVNSNMQGLRYIFNRHLRNNPGMKGKVTVKWAIDEFGKVLFCKVSSSNVNNKAFEDEILKSIRRWRFNRIEVAGDVTEVVYPFVFTQ